MLVTRFLCVHFLLAVALIQWNAGRLLLAGAAPESSDRSLLLGTDSHSASSEEKAATDLVAKLLLLDELVSLENDVIETKKKRSFPGFATPLDRLSASSTEVKSKQRKVVELPKRRFGIPLDRIGVNRLSTARG
ncbi:osteocrin [Pleurodeles waltl]|uniref:osteocrin n=1 Tax=Pleurodeles waltl TaxID=8319 RepID=UPI003709A870